MKSKLNFTESKLKKIVLDLAKLNGYEKPSTYLDELLNDVKQFNSTEFESDFFLNIHYLCKSNADKFWCKSHRQDISEWLLKASILTNVFATTWEKYPLSVPQYQSGPSDNTLQTHEYDSDIWNKDSFELFNYLVENYNATAPKQKFINIWYYLEYETADHFIFNYAKAKYRVFVFEKYKHDLKKINKPNNFQNQLRILHNHYSDYCNKERALK